MGVRGGMLEVLIREGVLPACCWCWCCGCCCWELGVARLLRGGVLVSSRADARSSTPTSRAVSMSTATSGMVTEGRPLLAPLVLRVCLRPSMRREEEEDDSAESCTLAGEPLRASTVMECWGPVSSPAPSCFVSSGTRRSTSEASAGGAPAAVLLPLRPCSARRGTTGSPEPAALCPCPWPCPGVVGGCRAARRRATSSASRLPRPWSPPACSLPRCASGLLIPCSAPVCLLSRCPIRFRARREPRSSIVEVV
mmetsp:Transcript_19895/g.43291  ORF Transcript_19895/g.43291 Transcript_19895/m.43291 type:complete len:253 (-) Transcript_19895:567-1325(-)